MPSGLAHSSAPPFATFGLHESWRPAYEWAVRYCVLRELLVVIDTCLTHDNSTVLGALLTEIAQADSLSCLHVWSETEPAAASLYRLGLAVRLHPEILAVFRPLSKAISARSQLKKNLGRDYLVALVLEWLKGVEPQDRPWIQVIRTWILFQAVLRAHRGVLQDENLRELATGVRLACERDANRVAVLVSLRTNIRGFESLNRHLADHAKSAALRIRNTEGAIQRTLLNAVVAVAKGQDSADEIFVTGTHMRILASLVPARDSELATSRFGFRPIFNDDEDDAPHAEELSGEDVDDGVVLVDVDPAKPYAHQRLGARSILLLTVEEYLYLPWSWSKPNSNECDWLRAWIGKLRSSELEMERMLGALSWIASVTGRSLRRVLDFRVQPEAGVEWCLDPLAKRLHRLPPRRDNGWLPDSEAAMHWVRTVADNISIPIPDDIAVVLRQVWDSNPTAVQVGELWRWPADPLSAWRGACPVELSRVTPGMLSQLLPQHLHEVTDDPVLARMLSSHPASAMPGACAYASWSRPYVEALIGQRMPPSPVPGQGDSIGGGSRLDPIEELLIKSLAEASLKLDVLRTSDEVIEFHNAYTAYCVTLMLAATGVRPVHDPFESLAHFDLTIGFVYVDDKGSDAAHAGRLVLLPRAAIDFVRNEYPRHLRQLAMAIESHAPILAETIRGLAAGHRDAGIPYFFLLESGPPLRWTSVSEESIGLTDLFQWPLPLRLFRHRVAIRLRWLGTDPEVVDSLLGHAEEGSATHGDDSFRIWHEDMRALRGPLETAFAMLRTKFPTTWFDVLPPRKSAVPRNAESNASEDGRLFGIARRSRNRRDRRIEVTVDAAREIDDFLEGRSLGDLSEEDLYKLATKLIFHDSGLPRTLGHLRYGVLMEKVDALWREGGSRLRIKKRFALARRLPSVFLPDACGVTELYEQLQKTYLQLKEAKPVSRLSVGEAVGLAVIGLCLGRRVADVRTLSDLAARRNVRLVVLDGCSHFEHGKDLGPDDPDACTKRYRIDELLLRIIDRHLGANDQGLWDKVVSPGFEAVAVALCNSGRLTTSQPILSDLASAISKVVDQVNVMTLPGVLAGWLGGRVESYSLGWRDWSRLVLGEILTFPPVAEDGNFATLAELPFGGVPLAPPSDADSDGTQSVAVAFLDQIKKVLETQTQDPAENNSRDKRKVLANALGDVIAQYNGRVSTAVLMLGQWFPAILYRPGKRGRYIAAVSLIRYHTALASRFADLGSDFDLLTADEDEVTEFYSDILESLDLEHGELVAGRLGDFHRWASSQGVSDPDWSEMPEVMRGRRAAPGFIAESEYQSALKMIQSDMSIEHEERLARASLLVYCYRYALREKEALGLEREDIQRCEGKADVVFVRDNRRRKLKTRRSRRQVPLLYELSPLEVTVVRDAELLLESEQGDDSHAGILQKILGDRARLQRTVRSVIQVLKQVTGNPRAVLHHARHTPPNRIAAEILTLKSQALARAMRRDGSATNAANVGRVLLGTSGLTRRTSWALARYTGHAGSGTLFKSYFHFFDLWLDEVLPTEDKPPVKYSARVKVLDDLPRSAEIVTSLLGDSSHPAAVEVGVEQTVKFLRLLSRKRTVVESASATGLSESVAVAIEAEVKGIGGKMYLSKTPRKGGKQADDEFAFLRRVNEGAWRRLLRVAATMDVAIEKKRAGELRPLFLARHDIRHLVGATRQLVMWRDEHFRAVREFLDLLKLAPKAYEVGISKICVEADRVVLRAIDFGFIKKVDGLESAIAIAGKKQLDSAIEAGNDNKVMKRCCLLYGEDKARELRNRYELVVMFIAFAFAFAFAFAATQSPD